MPAADTAKTRTVGDIMSTPVVVAAPDDKVAEAAARMREQRVGSVIVVDEGRPVGILTERDLVRIAAAGADTGTATVRDWMTANPDSVAPDVEVATAFASLSEHGYRHIPVVDDDEVVGIVSMRDLMRIAQIQPAEHLAHEIPRGLEGVVVAETTIGDVRGLEGFYHYRQYNAVELAEKRSLEDVWYLHVRGRAADDAPSSPRSASASRRCARSPPRCRTCSPTSRGSVATRRRSTCCAPRSRCSARTSASSPSLDIDGERAAGSRRCRSARSCRRCSPRSTGCSTTSSRSTRTPSSRTRRTTSTC